MRATPTIVALALITSVVTRAGKAVDCEPSHETWEALNRLQVDEFGWRSLKSKQKMIEDELLSRWPDDVFLHMNYQLVARFADNDERNALINRYKQLADKHPGSKKYVFLYANALIDTDTPQAISLLKQIISTEPDYPLAHLSLADIYSSGRFLDRPNSRSELIAFYRGCSASLSSKAGSLLQREATLEMAAQYSREIRERLSKDAELDHPEAWETVWNLEFKAHPVHEHNQIRKQLAADLARLEAQSQGKGVRWLSLLRTGYKMAGDEVARRRIEDRIEAEFPDTIAAKTVFQERWTKQHPYPQSNGPGDRQAFYRAQLEMANNGLKKWPNDFEYLMRRFQALSALDDATPDEVLNAGQMLRNGLQDDPGVSATPPFEFQIAQAYVNKKVHVNEVPALIEEGWNSYRHRSGLAFTSDREPAGLRKNRNDTDLFMKTTAALTLLDAAQQLKNPDIAKAAVEALAATNPDKPYKKYAMWTVKAKWAELNGRKLDALLMYRAALDSRPAGAKPPGKDDVATSFDRLWQELGGTAEGKALWTAKPQPVEASTAQGWEKPTKELPAWQLPDLQGKTWKTASLQGKTVFINVWSTWCGPCRAEHIKLQKLYDRIKDRSDLQLLTFNIDDDIGSVAPYMKENNYTFPVLLAKDYVSDLLPLLSIPRNWIVDSRGKWQWELIGFRPDEKWEDAVLAKLQQAESNQ
jgi:thiol-disulfide isomerase/thioredoxin/Tfp pilus assembly protein PilF